MKKYIRTENGVYKIFDTHNGASNHWGYKVSEHLTLLLDEKDIKKGKTADTIEELCDVFVIKDNTYTTKNGDNHRYRFATKDSGFISIRQVLNEYDIDNTTKIYGAIWTNKGLIYVAKMNDKGELELL